MDLIIWSIACQLEECHFTFFLAILFDRNPFKSHQCCLLMLPHVGGVSTVVNYNVKCEATDSHSGLISSFLLVLGKIWCALSCCNVDVVPLPTSHCSFLLLFLHNLYTFLSSSYEHFVIVYFYMEIKYPYFHSHVCRFCCIWARDHSDTWPAYLAILEIVVSIHAIGIIFI